MKKEEAIKKINTMGNVGWIISNIAKVILIVAVIGMLLGTVVIAIIPKDFLKMSFAGTGWVEIDFGAMGIDLTDAMRDDITKSIASGDAKMDVEMNGVVNFQISIDIAMLIVVLVILALAYIFKYGAVLQRESDETL